MIPTSLTPLLPVLGVLGGALDPDNLLSSFGLLGLLIIVFAESGLLIGFFLPGDSLLFTAGLLSATSAPFFDWNIGLLLVLIPLAAIAGDQVGYLFGRKAGPRIFSRPDSRLFRQSHVDKAYSFFERYGGRAIVLARFVPVVRTFTPVVAGVSHMHYQTFVFYNVLGGVLWGAGVTLLGFLLGQIAFVRDNVEIILILIVVVSVLPIVVELLRARRRSSRGSRGTPGGVVADDAGPGTRAPQDDPQA